MADKVTATILFVDIMDSMELANYWDTIKYSNFLNEFQRLMQHGICIWREGIKQIKLAGDELVVFYWSKDITEDIVNAIQLANTLKLMWYAGGPNRKRVSEGKKILDLGIGINTGPVTYEDRPVVKNLKGLIGRRKGFEGLPISLAKRIESFSREGRYSRIMVGHQTMAELNRTYHTYEYEPMGLHRFKGMSQEVPVFELKSCYTLEAEIIGGSGEFDWEIKQLERIRVFEPSNIWLLMTLIDIYSHKKKYKKVEKFCRDALAVEDSVSNIHNELGEALQEQNKYEEALAHFDKAISLRWDSWPSYVSKSACLIFLGRYDEGIKTCEYGISNMPAWLAKRFGTGLYYNMAGAYARKGSKRKALTNIKKAVKLGGSEIVKALKKDEDRDFTNLYTNREFKRICEGKRKTIPKGTKKI
ncbi:MAG TPA: tetratricopeptide repeat protein [Sedimentisphaerales bacterium]|nr:tetratricopeptide repeat protein [Sedimentisphaerales bacterium]